MLFFDTHTHLDYLADQLELPFSQLINQATKAQVKRLMLVAVSAKNFAKITAYAQQYPQHLVYGLGLHPLYIAQHQYTDLDLLANHLAKQGRQCTAIAEIGLDKGIATIATTAMWYKQCEFLEAQLALAKQANLAVSLHSRNTHDQLAVLLKKNPLTKTGVIHAFSGSYQQAKRFIELGYKIGVGGIITYTRANKTRNTISKLPLDSLVLETDSPDMPVFGYQGQANQPERIKLIFEALCQLRSESAEQISQTIWQTSEKLFWPSLS